MVFKAGETAFPDADSGKRALTLAENRPQPVQVPTSTTAAAASPPSPPSTRQDNALGTEVPAHRGEISSLATQLHLALSESNGTPARHRLREPTPRTFAELATWLSARSSAVSTLLDSALALRA